jgi:hypothetical protein
MGRASHGESGLESGDRNHHFTMLILYPFQLIFNRCSQYEDASITSRMRNNKTGIAMGKNMPTQQHTLIKNKKKLNDYCVYFIVVVWFTANKI